jgi:predicted RNA-binding protein with PUA-like domain
MGVFRHQSGSIAVGADVTIQVIKSHPKIEDMVLVNNSRLSVQSVTKAQLETVCAMALMKI